MTSWKTGPEKATEERDNNVGLSRREAYSGISERAQQGRPKIEMSLVVKKPVDPDPKSEQVASTYHRETKRQKRLVIDDLYHYDHVGGKSPAMERAEEFRANLPAEIPSFLKTMVRSNVTTGFWLHLPMPFCKLHMPRNNITVTLEDENGDEYPVNYIVDKTALSAGWKKFSSARELMEGDVLVFQLVRASVFKVHIVRGNNSQGVFGLDASRKQNDSENRMDKEVIPNEKTPSSGPVSQDVSPENAQSKSLMVLDTNPPCTPDQPGKLGDEIGPDATHGTRLSNSISAIDCGEATSNGSLTVLVSGTAIDSDLSEYQRKRYLELCASQNGFLHDNLLKSINYKLAAEMISETVNIADAIKASNLSTSRADLEMWDKTLEGFELLGIKVGFLRARLDQIKNVASELESYRDAENKQAVVQEEMRTVQVRLSKLKKLKKRLDADIESLKANAERHEHVFQEEASAPW